MRIIISTIVLALTLHGSSVRAPSTASADAPAGPAAPVRVARTGIVHLDGRAVADDGGAFDAVGASLFWLAWGYKFDRARLEENLRTLADAGVDYVRALGDVGPDGWTDRTIDPAWPDYDEVIAGATDLAYDRYGLRVQWTIFGGSRHVPTAEARQRLVDRVAAMTRARPQKIFAIEVANESWQNGFEGEAGRREVLALGARLKAAVPNLVALSAPPNDAGAVCALYAGSRADVMTLHYDRDTSRGPWAPVWQPWTWPATDVGPGACAARLPLAIFNNEPIGPEASVNADDDPLRIAAAVVTTFLAGNAAYVLHTGAGVRGGGAEDRTLGRAANFDDVPEAHAIFGAIAAAKRYLPPDLPNWTRHDAASETAFRGITEALDQGHLAHAGFAQHGPDIIGALLGVMGDVVLHPQVAMTVDVVDPLTGAIATHVDAEPGTDIRLPQRARSSGDAWVIRARRR
ncbi:MAG TPA: hypothetical protein VG538_15910 [Vicinamibacterales bacterium]|nr:hypothetical protein [Vicinamibacterales bacterium]